MLQRALTVSGGGGVSTLKKENYTITTSPETHSVPSYNFVYYTKYSGNINTLGYVLDGVNTVEKGGSYVTVSDNGNGMNITLTSSGSNVLTIIYLE